MRILTILSVASCGERLYTNELTAGFLSDLGQRVDELHVGVLRKKMLVRDFNSAAALPDHIHVVDLGDGMSRVGYLSPGQCLRLVRAMRDVDYLYLVSGTQAVRACALSALFCSRPFAVYERGIWLDPAHVRLPVVGSAAPFTRPYVQFMTAARRRMLQHAHVVYTHGDALFAECKSITGVLVEKVVPMMPPLRGQFTHRADTCTGQRAKLLFVGGVGPKKGVEYLLRAIARLRASGRDVFLRMAVKVPLTPEQNELIGTLGISDALEVSVAVPWTQVLELYRTSDVLVLSSISEGFPRVLYEAMAQSLPIVATAVGGIPGFITHEQTGLLVPSRSEEALANAVARVIDERSLRVSLITNAFEKVKNFFNSIPHDSHAAQVVHSAAAACSAVDPS